MIALIASILFAQGLQDDPTKLGEQELAPSSAARLMFIRARLGTWITSLDFEARTARGEHELEGGPLACIGLDGGVGLSDTWRIEVFGEGAIGGDLSIYSSGVGAAMRLFRGPAILEDLIIEANAALFRSDVQIETPGFGEFLAAAGARLGLCGRGRVAGLTLEAAFELRSIEWEFKETVLAGDTTIGGLGIALSIAAQVEF